MDNFERDSFCRMFLNNPETLKRTVEVMMIIQKHKQEEENKRTLDDMAFGC